MFRWRYNIGCKRFEARRCGCMRGARLRKRDPMGQMAKYRQVEDFIKGGIADGSLKVGSKIMTEEQLGQRFGFSRMTVNKALHNLMNEGLIERIPGKGSFVAATQVVKPSDSSWSFTEDMAAIGLKAGSQLLSYEVIRAGEVPGIANKLALGSDDLVHAFARLRTGDGKPIAISYNYVAATIIPAIDVRCLDGSFYAFVESLGLQRIYQGSEFRAVLPTPEERKLLQADDIALFRVSHCTYTRVNGVLVPFEYTETNYNGDIYVYTSRD